MSLLRGSENLPPAEVVRAALVALRDRWWLVVLTAIVAAGGWLAWDGHKGDEHTARVLMAFPRTLDGSAFVAIGVVAPPPPTGAELRSDIVLRRLQRRRSPSLDYLRDHLQVVQHGDELSAELHARAPSQTAALSLASRWATNFILARNAVIGAQLTTARDSLRRDLSTARKARDARGVADARDRLRRLALASRTVQPDAQVVAAAAPISTGRSKAVTAALFVASGVLLGAALALLAAWWDRRLRTPAALAAAVSAPLVGVLPRDDVTAFRRAADELLLNLELLAGGDPPSSVLLAGADDQTSAEQVQEILAAALSRAGSSVVLAAWTSNGGDTDGTVPLQESFVLSGSWREAKPRLDQLGRNGVAIVNAGHPNPVEEAVLAARDFDAFLVCGTVGVTRADDVEVLADRLRLMPGVTAAVVAFEPSRRGGRPRLPIRRGREVGEARQHAEHEAGHHPDADSREHERQERREAHSER